MPPLEGEVPNEREAEGFVRKLSNKPLSQPVRAASSPFRGAKAAAPLREAKSLPYMACAILQPLPDFEAHL